LKPNCDYAFSIKGIVQAEKCRLCGGDTINFYTAVPCSDIIDSWKLGVLPEIVTAYILKHSNVSRNWIKEIIVHKQINMAKNGGITESIPILERKSENLRNSGIEYDAFVYFTPAPLKSYIRLNEKKGLMFSINILSGWQIF
jgi:hypothetical protein